MTLTIQICALGPHADLQIPIPRHAVIRGPSQSGKSTVLHAVCALLGGTAPDGGAFPAALIRDGEAAAVVEWGPMRRRLSRSGSKRGTVGEISANSARAWASALGHVGEHWADIGRHIVAPMGWAALMHTPRARGLSALLRAVLPQVDLPAMAAAEMDAHGGLRDSDPMHLRGAGGALALQREANSAADRAMGAAAQAAAHLGRLEAEEAPERPVEPPQERVEKAREYLALCDRWTAHDANAAAWERVAAAGEAGRQARAKWAAAVESMGERPADPGPAPSTDARDALAALSRSLDEAKREQWRISSRGGRDIAAAEAAADRWRASEPSAECGACGQALPSADAAAAAWETKLEGLEEATERAKNAADDADKCAAAEIDRLAALLSAAKDAADEEAARAAGWQADSDARANWDARRVALEQSEPAPPPDLHARPAEPGQGRPPAQYRPQAQALVSAADGYPSALERWTGEAAALERRKEAARAALEEAQNAAAEARAEAGRVQALVGVLRTVPGRAAASQAGGLSAALAGTGVSVEWADPETTTGPEVSVSVDGRPWVCASDGRQIMACLAFRLAIRRLAVARYPDASPMGYAALPVIVDRAQAWSGGWPPAHLLGGPVWRLETARGLSAVEVAQW